MAPQGIRARWSIGVATTIVMLDQLIKWLVTKAVGPGTGFQSRWLSGDWLGLSYAENTGVAFGLLRGRPIWMLILLSFIIVVLLGVFVHANSASRWIVIGAGMIGGGAIGNMIDRVALGYVRDFFAVGPWPSFNVADAAITCGVGVTLIGLILVERDDARSRESNGSPARNGRAETMDAPE